MRGRAAFPSRDTQHVVLAALLYTLFTAVLTYPISVHPASTSLGNDIDVQLYTWTLAWNAHALTDALTGYMREVTLAVLDELYPGALT